MALGILAKGVSCQPRRSIQEGAQDSKEATQVRRIPGKGEIVNRGELQIQFGAKNSTAAGEIGLYSFARKLSAAEAYPA